MSKTTLTLKKIATGIKMSEQALIEGLQESYGLVIGDKNALTDEEKKKIIQYVHGLKTNSISRKTVTSKKLEGKRGGIDVEFRTSKQYGYKKKEVVQKKVTAPPPPPPPPPPPKPSTDQTSKEKTKETKDKSTKKVADKVRKSSSKIDERKIPEKENISKPKAKKKPYIAPEENINPDKHGKSLYKLAQVDDEIINPVATKKISSNVVKSKVKIQSKHKFIAPKSSQTLSIEVGDSISLSNLAKKLNLKAKILVKHCYKMGEEVNAESIIDYDMAFLLGEELGHKVTYLETEEPDLENQIKRSGNESARSPIVTIMGHVDHGKTSLLDYIRKSKVADKEAGGITQHLSAYHVKTKHGQVTFVDTPGHAAFTAMRARGSQFTDIVVLIVAADDGVMPQTIEIIQHVKAAQVPMLVAINKIDKPDVKPDKVLQGLAEHDIIAESWGGDVPVVQLSAKTGKGVDELLEMLILQADIMELKAYHQGIAEGMILECRIDKGRGAVVSALVQNGELKQGDILLCGEEFGKVRGIVDSHSKSLKKVGPSIPVELFGFNGLPQVGDKFIAVKDEKQAREISEFRKIKKREEEMLSKKVSLDDLFSAQADQDIKEINLVIRADTNGSMEAIVDSLNKLSSDKIKVSIVAKGIGGIKEADATLAMAHNAIIIGFNVRADKTARDIIEKEGVDLHYYSIIYEVVDQVKQAILGRLDPEYKEEIIGIAEVRDVFHAPKIGAIAGCMVVEGEIKRNNPIRVLRGDVVIYEGVLESLRRFKEDVMVVKNNTECGIGVKNYNDIKVSDKIEVYERTEIKPIL